MIKITKDRIKHLYKNPLIILDIIFGCSCFHLLNDKTFIKLKYFAKFGKGIDLYNPVTFNEKMQYFKLFNRDPLLTKYVDKYEAKKLVAEMIGEKYVIKTLGVWNRYDEINFDILPNQFVLKTTHDSGGVYICVGKENIGQDTKRFLNYQLNNSYFYKAREWPYKNVTPRILAEEYMSNLGNESLLVYKVFCFHGKPEIIQVIQNDKRNNESIDYFDTNWNLLELKQNFPNSKNHISKPRCFENMINLSKILSKDFPFIRIEWYVDDDGNLFFSEFTFFSDAGFAKFYPPAWDAKLGALI